MTTSIPLPVTVRYDANPATTTLVDAAGEDVLMLPYREQDTIERLAKTLNALANAPDLTQLRQAVAGYYRAMYVWQPTNLASDLAVHNAAGNIINAALALCPRESLP